MTQTLTAVEPTTSSRLGRRLWAILAVVLIADAIDLMDSTIMNIAAPTIQREIGGEEGLIKWLGASYALALGILLVVGGRLGDRFGRRRLFLIGIAGFGVASVLCAVAIDPAFLIAARLLQGAFGALLIPQGIGILIATFSREQFPTAASMFGPVLGGASIVGPILAGFLVGANIGGLTWRPLFLINIVLCAAGLIAGWKLLPPDRDLQKVSIDGLGSALLAVGMLGVLFGLIQGSTNGWTAVPVICLGLGVAGFIGFALRQRLATNPLIVPALFHNRGFTSGLLIGLGYFAVVNGFAYVVSLYFQMHLGLSPVGAALAMMPMMVGIIIASFVARPLIPKLGRNLVVAGLATTLAGIVALIAISIAAGDATNQWMLAPAILVLGLGMGASFSSIYDVAIGDLTTDLAGSASGSLSAVQQLASAIGSAVVTTIYFQTSAAADANRPFIASLVVVGAITAVCLIAAPLPPKRAPQDAH
ncbi:MFS transporter [Propionibacterium freudenreichii]|uniref:MFS transporter n=1 Tax=Propionibacterium freudenreichii TaxID=1744 RepID=UPI000BC336A9|nr:MFS transporter [Propionibacterium freudenreichii]MDK9593002.1 MFS transporter [Propionibacterium freudenreichii]WFF34592.1 MFS transporter [Propionibacterium freudenreichii]WFF36821.1 MFS transporter [Propionibacterium freudenreichii]SBN50663.1 Actinorhodin transporter [Propionibacterium freudenreichii]